MSNFKDCTCIKWGASAASCCSWGPKHTVYGNWSRVADSFVLAVLFLNFLFFLCSLILLMPLILIHYRFIQHPKNFSLIASFLERKVLVSLLFGFFFFVWLGFFSLMDPVFSKNYLFIFSDCGRVCAVLLPDQKKWKLQEHSTEELQAQRKKPGILLCRTHHLLWLVNVLQNILNFL